MARAGNSDFHSGPPETASQNAIRGEGVPTQAELSQLLLQMGERHAEVDRHPQEHVSADSREAIQVENASFPGRLAGLILHGDFAHAVSLDPRGDCREVPSGNTA